VNVGYEICVNGRVARFLWVPRLFCNTRFSYLLRAFDFFGSYKKEHSGKNATNQLMVNERQPLVLLVV
jgi:hypothetical protein